LDVQKQLMEHESRGSALEKLGSLTRNLEDSNLQKQIAAESGIEVRFATDAPTPVNSTYTNAPAGEFRLESTGSKTRYAAEPSRKLSYTPTEFINLMSDYGDSPVLEKVANSRKAKLVKAWNSSNEGRFLDEYKQLHNEFDVSNHGAWMSDGTNVTKREQAIRAEIDSLRETNKQTLLEVPKLQKQIVDIIDNETALTTQNIPKGKNVAIESKVLAEEAKGVAEGLRLNPSSTLDVPRYAVPDKAKISSRTANIVGEMDSIDQIVNDLQFDKVVERGLQKQALEYIGRLSKDEQILLKEKIVANARLAKAMETKELMLDGKVAKKVSPSKTENVKKSVKVEESIYRVCFSN
jgi:hypothetical protein